MTKNEQEMVNATINAIKSERDQLAEDKRELVKALELIEGNFYDARQVARNALDKIKAREGDKR